MSDMRPQIATQIRLAAFDHAQAFPNGDWRAVNERLGGLRLLAMDIDRATCGMGNAECSDRLQAEWALDNG